MKFLLLTTYQASHHRLFIECVALALWYFPSYRHVMTSVRRFLGKSHLLRKILSHLRQEPLSSHLYVYGIENVRDTREIQPSVEAEIREIRENDEALIDELTSVDEWRITKSVTTRDLKNGWRCFVARASGHIAACCWVFPGSEFEDWYLKRKISIGNKEAYFYREFCVPEFRGRGILPFLHARICREFLPLMGKTAAFALTRMANKPMLRVFGKMGWRRMGRMGFVEMFGVRFHYLWGRRALISTHRRVYFEITKE